MKYRVLWTYRSGIGGPWQAGDVVDVDEPLATAINHDSPGVLVLESEIKTRDMEAPPADRMVKVPSGRRKHTVANEGQIDGASFKATKGKGQSE